MEVLYQLSYEGGWVESLAWWRARFGRVNGRSHFVVAGAGFEPA